MEEKEELILLKSEVKNIKSDIEEIKKDVKNHSEFSTQIALLTKTVNDLVDTVNKLINNVDKLNSKDSEKWNNIVRKIKKTDSIHNFGHRIESNAICIEITMNECTYYTNII